MADVLKTGVEWLTSQLKNNVGQSVTYRRGAYSVVVSATLGESSHDIVTPAGIVVEVHSRDFLIDVADLVLNGVQATPERGDTIEHVDSQGLTVTHELMSLSNQPAWKYSDPYRLKYRIHTERIKLPS